MQSSDTGRRDEFDVFFQAEPWTPYTELSERTSLVMASHLHLSDLLYGGGTEAITESAAHFDEPVVAEAALCKLS